MPLNKYKCIDPIGLFSDKDIKQALNEGSIKIKSKKNLYIGPCSVDLRMSNMAKFINISPIKVIDIKNKNSISYDFIKFKKLIVNPGDFYILSTEEKITLSRNIAGFVFARSSMARLGLNIHLAGFVDAGFSGTITLEMSNFNKNPIIIYPGMRMCQISFISTSSPVKISYAEKKDSKYQNQVEPTESKIFYEK